MKDGWIKVAAADLEVALADVEKNRDSIERRIAQAEEAGVSLLVLPELCLTGATLGDLFFSESLLRRAEQAAWHIAEATAGLDVVAVFGLPLALDGRLYNCAAVVSNGELLGFVPSLRATRHFAAPPAEPGRKDMGDGVSVPLSHALVFKHSTLGDFRFGITVGNAWQRGEDILAPLASAGAMLILNPTAAPTLVGSAESTRIQVLAASARWHLGFVSAGASCGESTTDYVCSSRHIIAENGELLAENPPFGASELLISDIDVSRLSYDRIREQPAAMGGDARSVYFDGEPHETTLTRTIRKNPFVPEEKSAMAARAAEILELQAHGLARRLAHTHASGLILGISGGLDSTLALLVSVRATALLGRPSTDIHALTMPGFGTTARTKSNAVRLCEELGVRIDTVDITPAVRLHFADIGHDESVRDVTYENSQARERTQILMDMANREGSLLVGTGDLSELALGWATYNGDHMSMYGVNASLPKTLMRHIVRYEAERLGGEIGRILADVVDTPVSPELLPFDEKGEIAQKTEDLVGPYELHDFFLYYMLRYGFGPAKLCRMAKIAFADEYEDAVILHWLRTFVRRFISQQFKRSCLPDGPAVGVISLSPRTGFVMPSDASSALWLSELDGLS